MLQARPDELRLALIALTAAAGQSPDLPQTCAELFDAAAGMAGAADRATLRAIQGHDHDATRFGATRVLAGLCATCGACARGVMAEAPPTRRSGAGPRPDHRPRWQDRR